MTGEVLFAGDSRWLDAVIYALVDPREPEVVRYVGQSTSPGTRYASHLYLPPPPRPRCDREVWVARLREEGVYPAMLVVERIAVTAQIDDRERHWIEFFRAKGQADLNGVMGRRRPIPKVVRETLQAQVAKSGKP